VLTPESSVRYKTVEFDIVAHANRFGFRGDESTIRTGQIVAIGDSYTFGWGNNLGDTWEKVLARKLAENGKPTEVYNLGRPGADPQDYLDIAKTYIPLLKPRLIIVALLQGDDIAQLIERGMRVPVPSIVDRVKDLAWEHIPNLVALARSTGAMLAATPLATANWGADAAHIIAEQKLQLDDELRALALAGSVNPGGLQLVATDPNRMPDAYSARPQAVTARRQVVDILRAISALASAYGSHVMLLSMPSGNYFNSASLQMARRMGFVLPDSLIGSPEPDAFTAAACREIGIDCLGYSDLFRAQGSRATLWYPVDGHLTADGNRLLGDALARDLTPQL
jgi:lysophospholipase L1-like esterase